jgi:SAM-dependent methyltransferase
MSAPRAPSFAAIGQAIPARYERHFVPAIGAPAARALVALAAPAPGERILDVACGTGIVARLAAVRVAPGGEVAGLDPNPGMLAIARAVEPGIRWIEARAEDMPLPDGGFDAVLCQMGLQFFDDRLAGLREMRRVLAASGRLVLNLPGPTPAPFAHLRSALGRHAGPDAAGFIDAVFSLHDPDEVRGLLEEAGLRDPRASSERVRLSVPPAREFLRGYIAGTPLAIAVERLDERGRAELEREVAEAWAPFADGPGLALTADITWATARA